MDVLMLFFSGKRKYVSLAVIAAAAILIVSRIKSAPATTEIALKKTQLVRTVYGLGTVQAEKTYHLRIGIAANIVKLHVREGDVVSKGARLVELDQVPVMTAPFAGTVTAVAFKQGEAVFPQNSILTVTDLTRKYITASLDEKAAVLIRQKQIVRIAFDGLPGRTYSGSVTSVYPSDGQFIVKIESAEMPAEILPGMSADLAIEAGTKTGVFVAPIRAVREGKVAVWRAGKKIVIPVQLGLTQGEMVEIISTDLAEGDVLRYQQ
ncbi:MAG: efflux RND transporter periplasmic adaptor subunit [Leptospiraceae bacterium]|nr:efflux RND transporter periplasmic adaptor subunit [Leptospiraceae bacterium]